MTESNLLDLRIDRRIQLTEKIGIKLHYKMLAVFIVTRKLVASDALLYGTENDYKVSGTTGRLKQDFHTV